MRAFARSLIVLSTTIHLGSLSKAAAAEPPSGFTFQGRIFDSSGTRPVEDASVLFKVQIRSADGMCLLFEETHSRDMTGTSGVFTLIVGEGTNSNTSALTLRQVFDNGSSKTGAAGCIYSPLSGDSRKLRLSYDNGKEVVTLSTDQRILSVPNAMNSLSLQGLSKESFLQVSTSSTQSKLDSVLAKSTELVSLASGTSSLYAKTTDLPMSGGVLNLTSGGVRVPDTPAGNEYVVNKKYTDANLAGRALDLTSLANGQVLTWNASQNKWTAASLPTGTMTSIVAGTGLSGGMITGTGTISLAPVGTAGTFAKVTTDAYGRVTSGGPLTEADLPAIVGAGKISGNTITSGTIAGTTALNTTGHITTTGNVQSTNLSANAASLKSLSLFENANTHKVLLKVPSSLSSDYSLTLPPTTGALGQVLATDGNGQLTWSNLPDMSSFSTASGDLDGAFPSPQVVAIRGIPVAATAPVNGQLNRFNGSNWSPGYIGISDLKTTLGAPQIPTTCSSAQTLTYNLLTDQFQCQNISLSLASIPAIGSAATKNVPASGNAAAFELVLGSDTRLTDSRAPAGVASGDLSGSYPSPTLAPTGVAAGTYSKVTVDSKGRVTSGSAINLSDLKGLGGITQFPTTCTTGQTLVYQSLTDTFSCANIAISSSQVSGLGSAAAMNVGTTAGTLAAGNDTRITGAVQSGATAGGDLSGTNSAPTVAKIQGVAVSNAVPVSGQALAYNSTTSKWEPGTVAFRSMQVFDSTATFNVPAGVTKVFVRIWGGGGGGGGGTSSGGGGSGGAGGGYGEAVLTVIPSTDVLVTVAEGGDRGGSSSPGLPGGTSSFGNLLAATGGAGGIVAGAAPSAGGTSDAHFSINGAPGEPALINFGGQGGDSPNGGSGNYGSANTGSAGFAGQAPGGGGGGGAGIGGLFGSASGGGKGARGRVVVWW